MMFFPLLKSIVIYFSFVVVTKMSDKMFQNNSISHHLQ